MKREERGRRNDEEVDASSVDRRQKHGLSAESRQQPAVRGALSLLNGK